MRLRPTISLFFILEHYAQLEKFTFKVETTAGMQKLSKRQYLDPCNKYPDLKRGRRYPGKCAFHNLERAVIYVK